MSRPPTRDELLTAYDATIPDLVGPEMDILLVGINPSLYSGWTGYHFARPGNRLWPTLQQAGLTPRVLQPADTDAVRAAGLGITNLVARATARAAELSAEEIRAGVPSLRALVRRWQPRVVAVLGVSAYRIGFGEPRALVGRQDRALDGSALWVLPNPSGLNAHYQQPALTAAYARLRNPSRSDGWR